MKKRFLLLVCIALCMSACTQSTSEEGHYILDLNQSYPSKELYIQDIADVSYAKIGMD